MAKNRFAPKQLNELMGKWSNKMVSYSEKSQAMSQWQSCLEKAVGPVLIKKCRIGNYRDGTLVIEAASATLATRLNFLKMDILSQFRASGMFECAQVKIVTNPEAQQRLTPKKENKTINDETHKRRSMSEQTGLQLIELANNAPSSLQAKLLKLASHAQKK
ncbi:DciA family protein [Pseudoalteromonas aurantia]|uniref:DUF721 domain-containing protein n=1 Tax=Pseudoalteromonas aurantia 208 TaxID=1314867 RepID=A0ABR9EEA3_9GAMM|nr:DciA family protein [Pseudoalteromonas aurantia]MBE0369313.1 hypothetical protein [Pseudoalteromonas aurantia 208]